MREYCVTGGAGLIASHLIKALLDQGHSVRATVRDTEDETKVGFLRNMEGAKERLRLFQANLTVDASFDEAIQGAYGVFHVASPVLLPRPNDVQALIIDPTVKGTKNVLNSCLKSTTLKRIVLTSSCYAINQRDDAHQISVCNESHWSDLEYCKRNNTDLSILHMWYAYAKTVAEEMAWKTAQENGLDLVVVHPSFVIGPLLNQQPSSTLKFLLDLIKGAYGGFQDRYIRFVHIDDVVDVHILAMEETKAEGRIICSSAVANWSEIIDMLKAKYPMYPYESMTIKEDRDQSMHDLDTSKVMQLGFPGFKSIPEMFDDCIGSFQEKGLL